MGFKKHTTLKCHHCKATKVVGGSKKQGSLDSPGWKFKEIKDGHWVSLCPTCSKREEKK